MTEAMYDLLHVLDIVANMILSLSIMIYVIYKTTKGK
jgi:hypothetical protein